MAQQETYWDEEAQQFYTYGPQKKNYTHVYIVAYFLLLACLMVPAERLHMGMQAIFFAMVGAGVLFGVGFLVFKFVARRVKAMNLTKKGFAQMMVGYAPEATEVTQVSTSSKALVPAASTDVAPYDEDNNDDLPDRIVEEFPLHLADDFQPSVRKVLGTTTLLCGIRRSGKSNMLAVMAEELGKYEVPLVIFDTEDEYGEMVDRQWLPNPVHVGSSACVRDSAHPEYYVELDIAGAYNFGRAILDGRLQAVVNLKCWDNDNAAIIMSEIVDGLNDWENDRENSNRLPVMAFLDEAQKWLPQNEQDRCVTKENQTLLRETFCDIIVARGGKRGFGLVVATQRYSQLNKNVLQSQWKFLFQQTEEVDIDRYKKQGLPGDEIPGLLPGQCYIFAPMAIGFKTIVRERFSPHLANTPGLENLKRVKKAPADIVLRRSFSTMPAIESDVNSTRQLPNEEREPVVEDRKPSEPTLLQRGINAYKEGATSQAKLAAALDITLTKARELQAKILLELEKEDQE